MPRWGFQTSLLRWREPAFYVYVALVAYGLVHTVTQQNVLRTVSPGGWLLSWALLTPLYALPIIVAVIWLDLYEREPASLMLGAVVWGAVVATTIASRANDGWLAVISHLANPVFAVRWGPSITAPFDEELAKFLGVVAIYQIARTEIDDLMDGFVYGALVGLGFAVVEDVFYFIAVYGGSTAAVLSGFWVRVVSAGLYGHVLYTALSGMGLAYFVTRRGEVPLARRFAVMIGLLLAAMAAHALWDSPLFDFVPRGPLTLGNALLIPLAMAVKGLPFLIFLAALVWLARRREERWFASIMTSEVGLGGITEEELEVLTRPRLRRRVVREMRRRAGRETARLLRRLQKEQINLAMVRTRVDRDDDPDLVRQRDRCMRLRAALLQDPRAREVLQRAEEHRIAA
ncbi:MAG: PrsW family intramembrane metalloprotease [Actinomycetota bacterium]